MSALSQAFHATDPQKLLASVWQRNLPVVRTRLATLDDLTKAGRDGLLSDDARSLAADIAHKLAGSLGMFGYLQGTEIARSLELLLNTDGPVTLTDVQMLTTQLQLAVPV